MTKKWKNLKSNNDTNERIELINVKLSEIADMKAKQADQEERISFLEMDRALMRNEIERLKESIASEEDTDEENDAIISRENLRRKEMKKKKVLVQSPSSESVKKSF